MNLCDWALYSAAFLGHAALWIVLVNHLHARPFPRWFLDAVSWPIRFFAILGPIALLGWASQGGVDLAWFGRTSDDASLPWAWQFYVAFCALIALIGLPPWLVWVVRHQQDQVTDHQVIAIHDLSSLGRSDRMSWKTRLLASLPGNQSFQLSVTEKSLALRRLPVELDGLTIAHLSDLHFTGAIARPWYLEVVRRTLDLEADLVVISGDIVEEPSCLPWLREICGALQSRHGVYFVLGNHDTRIDYRITRRELSAAGLIDLGSQDHTLTVRGRRIALIGNELPWIQRATTTIATAEPDATQPVDLQIGVAHSPDQFPWARQLGLDLLLAGHTHGGQIRIPGLGPIVCPSKFGVRYASGTYFEPPTVMHVSRGLAGDTLLRWNCWPELTRLTLRSRVRPTIEEVAVVGGSRQA